MAHVFALWDQRIGLSQIADVGSVICWAAKWHGDKAVEFRSDHHDGHEEMMTRAWELVDEADAIVTYNGVAFDMKHLRREWVLAGLGPPTPYKDIDLLKVVRQNFKFASSKLDHVSQQLGLGAKVQHSGFDLWLGCIAGDPKAWETMRRYNMQDCRLTEALYLRLLPWIENHPNRALYDEDSKGGCPRCPSKRYRARGYRTTAVATYRRYECLSCGGFFSGTSHTDRVHTRAI